MVDGVIRWFDTVMKVCSTKLIKMIIGPKALNQKPFPQEEVQQCTDEFFTMIVPVLNKRLDNRLYMSCNQLTYADIIIYNELKTIMVLYNKNID